MKALNHDNKWFRWDDSFSKPLAVQQALWPESDLGTHGRSRAWRCLSPYCTPVTCWTARLTSASPTATLSQKQREVETFHPQTDLDRDRESNPTAAVPYPEYSTDTCGWWLLSNAYFFLTLASYHKQAMVGSANTADSSKSKSVTRCVWRRPLVPPLGQRHESLSSRQARETFTI